MLPQPPDRSVQIRGVSGAEKGEKFRSAAPSKLPLTSPLSAVRHFLKTALSFCISNPKPFRHTQTQPLAPPAPAAGDKGWMCISKMVPKPVC